MMSYQCCFCGEVIAAAPPDVASLLYTTCFDGSPELQKRQTVYCHTECLRARLHESVNLFIADCLDLRTQEDAPAAEAAEPKVDPVAEGLRALSKSMPT